MRMTTSSTSLMPMKIERSGQNELLITWGDGQTLRYTAKVLRDACPCATCREKQAVQQKNPLQLAILKPEETLPLTIRGMKPIGVYAYTIDFSDGHNTGIYTFEVLRSLGAPISG
jgi:DUF971 family protein